MRFNMSRRASRRTLVVLIYAAFAALMAASWFLDHWRMSGMYFLFSYALLVSWFVLGGYTGAGLVRPFGAKATQGKAEPPPGQLLQLEVNASSPKKPESLEDEREGRRRDHAHYQAFQCFAIALLFLCILANPRLVGWLHLTADRILDLLHGGLLAALMLALSLPQAILLWTEPDMETEAEAPSA
jgi:hypothetical protein